MCCHVLVGTRAAARRIWNKPLGGACGLGPRAPRRASAIAGWVVAHAMVLLCALRWFQVSSILQMLIPDCC